MHSRLPINRFRPKQLAGCLCGLRVGAKRCEANTGLVMESDMSSVEISHA